VATLDLAKNGRERPCAIYGLQPNFKSFQFTFAEPMADHYDAANKKNQRNLTNE
jgi:hypothetical protein